MQRLWTANLALSLGLLVGGARGGDNVSRPTAAPAATLDQPVPLPPAGGRVDPQVRPTAFIPSPATTPPGGNARPLPIGPPVSDATVGNNWQRPPDPLPAPTAIPAPPPGGILVDPGFGPAPGLPFTAAPGLPFTAAPGLPLGDDCGSCAGGTCDPQCCDPCGGGCWGCSCCPNNRFYANAEYLLWWIRGTSLPPLVTAGSVSDAIPGALGQPNTLVLFGNQTVGTAPRSGGRFLLGYWFNDCHTLGIEIGAFFLGDQTVGYTASSNGSQVLARPIVDAATGLETTELVAGPGALSGIISVQDRTRFWGYQANFRTNICCGCNYYADLIYGFRGLGLDDMLSVQERLTVLPPPGGGFVVNDRFDARNRFYGGQVGAQIEFRRNKWFLNAKTMIALGDTNQSVNISGTTLIMDPLRGTTNNTGGLLALPSNIGDHSRDKFTVVPELGLNVGYQFTNHIRAYVGYNYIYWSSVVRPGNQVDRAVNTNQLPPAVAGGPNRPQFSFNGSDFWAQGVNFGLEFRY